MSRPRLNHKRRLPTREMSTMGLVQPIAPTALAVVASDGVCTWEIAPTAPRRRISHHCSNALPLPRSPPLPDHGQQQPLITSRCNPLVKQLRQLHTTWGQREAGGVLLKGTHLLEEALRHGLALQRLVFTRRWAENYPALLAQVPPWFHQLVRAGRDGLRSWTPGDSQSPGPACLPDP